MFGCERRNIHPIERDGRKIYIDPFTGREHEWGTGRLIVKEPILRPSDVIQSL